MMHVTVAERLEDLAESLSDSLGVPLADPMATELVVVPTAGIRRWLSLRLARRLGSSGPDRCDGISANIDFVFPGALLHRVLGRDERSDPWSVGRMAWTILEVLAGHETAGGDCDASEPFPGLVPEAAPGVTAWARARRLADLFDRYMTHRPAMIRAWADGEQVDGAGRSIDEHMAWQPRLWSLLRHRIGVPSPPEAAPAVLAELAGGAAASESPQRLSLFGVTSIPGGVSTIELLDALSEHRDVGLYLHQPSTALFGRISREAPSSASPVLRSQDTSTDAAEHPLLRSWGRPARETAVLLGERARGARPVPAPDPAGTTLLGHLQDALRNNRPPVSEETGTSTQQRPGAPDRSVVLHCCQGDTRQVEVLRDQILHLLAAYESLSEDDILVLCPALDRFAPVIEAVLGPSTDQRTQRGNQHRASDAAVEPAPALRYHLSDRSLGSTYPMLAAMGSLVMLLGSRFSDAALSDFAGLAPVRRRFGLDDEALALLEDWIDAAGIRWGLDPAHRVAWGIPEDYTASTWAGAIDRILMGIAVSDDPSALTWGHLAPVPVEGDGITVAGRVADLLTRLGLLAERVGGLHPIGYWLDVLGQASGDLLAEDPGRQWERQRLDEVFERISQESRVPAAGRGPDAGTGQASAELSLTDIRHMLGDHLGWSAARPQFFTGGVTFSTPTPLRGVPHRVVCLLGMDETSFRAGSPDGDDLLALEPHLGDRDRREDLRQALLDSVLGARDHLVVLRNDRSVVTNQEVPPSVVVAELTDALLATAPPSGREQLRKRITLEHPRQRFGEANFVARDDSGTPWSFDGTAMRAAMAARGPGAARPFVDGPLRRADDPAHGGEGGEDSVVELGDLREFLENPTRYFLRRVLGVSLPERPEGSGSRPSTQIIDPSGLTAPAPGRDLVVELGHLENWAVRNRLLDHLLAGGSTDEFVALVQAEGILPPGETGAATLRSALEVVEPLAQAYESLAIAEPEARRVEVDVHLADGTRVVGTVSDRGVTVAGPVEVTVSKRKDKDVLAIWLDLLALGAHDGGRAWRAVHLSQGKKDRKVPYAPVVTALELSGSDPSECSRNALDALSTLVAIHRLGLREPIPFFPTTSRKLALGKFSPSDWSGSPYNRGDLDDTWVRAVFGELDYEQLTSLEVQPHDPPGGESDRARRYAEAIWGLHDTSVTDVSRMVEQVLR